MSYGLGVGPTFQLQKQLPVRSDSRPCPHANSEPGLTRNTPHLPSLSSQKTETLEIHGGGHPQASNGRKFSGPTAQATGGASPRPPPRAPLSPLFASVFPHPGDISSLGAVLHQRFRPSPTTRGPGQLQRGAPRPGASARPTARPPRPLPTGLPPAPPAPSARRCPHLTRAAAGRAPTSPPAARAHGRSAAARPRRPAAARFWGRALLGGGFPRARDRGAGGGLGRGGERDLGRRGKRGRKGGNQTRKGRKGGRGEIRRGRKGPESAPPLRPARCVTTSGYVTASCGPARRALPRESAPRPRSPTCRLPPASTLGGSRCRSLCVTCVPSYQSASAGILRPP